jgi:UDP-N-acetylmuramoylalanine--D-glutamate ligase
MDASLFIQLAECPMIGVTGTKGKTTTASLIAHILEQSGKTIVRAGISQVGFLDKINQLTGTTRVVAELSSWRLSSFASHQYSPSVGVVTNIYPDHLNYYKKMELYIADKENIFLFQKPDDTLVLNRDNEGAHALAAKAKSQVVWFSEQPLSDGQGKSFRVSSASRS